MLFLKQSFPIFVNSFGMFVAGTSQGYHMYIETSSPRKPNDTARLLSTVFKPSKQSCIMRFFYHMYGKHVDMLAVKMKFSQDPKSPMKIVWKKTGKQSGIKHIR